MILPNFHNEKHISYLDTPIRPLLAVAVHLAPFNALPDAIAAGLTTITVGEGPLVFEVLKGGVATAD